MRQKVGGGGKVESFSEEYNRAKNTRSMRAKMHRTTDKQLYE